MEYIIETPKTKRSQCATALYEEKRQEVLALTSRLMWYVFLFFRARKFEKREGKRERIIGKAEASFCNRRSPILAQRNSKKGLQETNKEMEHHYIREEKYVIERRGQSSGRRFTRRFTGGEALLSVVA